MEHGLNTEIPLAGGFVEEDGCCCADVKGIHCVGHGDEDGFIAFGENGSGDAMAFAAENNAAVAGEVRLRHGFLVGVRMGGDAANAVGAELAEGLG